MEKSLLNILTERVNRGENAILATVLEVGESSPARSGSIMAIFEDGETIGTVGGGSIEYSVIREAKKLIESGESKVLEFNLGQDKLNTDMYCGGEAKVFLKSFIQRDKFIIIGSGHVANEIYRLAENLKYHIHVLDYREELCKTERFPNAELHIGDLKTELDSIDIDKDTYIVIAGPNHKYDQEALSYVLNSDAKYIGMLGSKKKFASIRENLIDEGFSNSKIDRVHCPIGIDVGSSLPAELAIGVMAEISIVKNTKM